MQIWLALFVVLLGAAELFQWVAGLHLPTSFFVGAGLLLAIASNADKPAGLPWKTASPPPKGSPQSSSVNSKESQALAPPSPSGAQEPQRRSPEPSISFTIRSPKSSQQPASQQPASQQPASQQPPT